MLYAFRKRQSDCIGYQDIVQVDDDFFFGLNVDSNSTNHVNSPETKKSELLARLHDCQWTQFVPKCKRSRYAECRKCEYRLIYRIRVSRGSFREFRGWHTKGEYTRK